MPEDPITQELAVVQTAREAGARAAAEDADLPDEAAQHTRRADKAAYLRSKLAERAASEREGG